MVLLLGLRCVLGDPDVFENYFDDELRVSQLPYDSSWIYYMFEKFPCGFVCVPELKFIHVHEMYYFYLPSLWMWFYLIFSLYFTLIYIFLSSLWMSPKRWCSGLVSPMETTLLKRFSFLKIHHFNPTDNNDHNITR